MKRKTTKREQAKATLSAGAFVRLNPDTRAKVETIANREIRTVSAVLRLLIEEALINRSFEPKRGVAA